MVRGTSPPSQEGKKQLLGLAKFVLVNALALWLGIADTECPGPWILPAASHPSLGSQAGLCAGPMALSMQRPLLQQLAWPVSWPIMSLGKMGMCCYLP